MDDIDFNDVRLINTHEGDCYRITNQYGKTLWWCPVKIDYYRVTSTTEHIGHEDTFYGLDGHLPEQPEKIDDFYKNKWSNECKHVTCDISTYLSYSHLYNVTYKKDLGGEATPFKEELLSAGTTVEYPTPPFTENYSFIEWQPPTVPKLSSDTTIIAKYLKNQIIINKKKSVYTYDEGVHEFVIEAHLNNDNENSPSIEYSSDNEIWGTEPIKSIGKIDEQTSIPVYYRLTYDNYPTIYDVGKLIIDASPVFDVQFKYLLNTLEIQTTTENVRYGQSAPAPEIPELDPYTFDGWDKDFSRITESMVVSAEYSRRVISCFVFSSLSLHHVCNTCYYGDPVACTPSCDNEPIDRYTWKSWYTYKNGEKTDINTSELTTFTQNNLSIYPYYNRHYYLSTYVLSSFDPIFYKWYDVLSGENLKQEDIEKPEIPGASFSKFIPSEWNPVNSDTELTMKYSTGKIIITYHDNIPVIIYLDGNGGDLDLIHGKEQYNLYKDDNFPILYDPSREGYNFIGWSKESEHGGQLIPTTGICTFKENTNLFAQWQYIDPVMINIFDSYTDWTDHAGNQVKKFQGGRYKITLIGSGGSSLVMISGTQKTWSFKYITGHASGGSGCYISGLIDIPKPFTQITINVSQHGGDTTFSSDDTTININADCGTDGSAPSPHTMEKGHGGNINNCKTDGMIQETVYKVGGSDGDGGVKATNYYYDFPYYNGAPYPYNGIDLGGGGSSYGTSYTTTGYLHVERYMEVKFVDHDNTILKDTQYIIRNTDATPPPNPSRIGYTFIGWNKPYTNITEDTVCKAQYNVIYYNINYVTEHGSTEGFKSTYTVEETYTPPILTEKGWKFKGWTPQKIIKGTTGDITFTASWEELTPQLVYSWVGSAVEGKTEQQAQDEANKFLKSNPSFNDSDFGIAYATEQANFWQARVDYYKYI